MECMPEVKVTLKMLSLQGEKLGKKSLTAKHRSICKGAKSGHQA